MTIFVITVEVWPFTLTLFLPILLGHLTEIPELITA
jgi:hypothetical protein